MRHSWVHISSELHILISFNALSCIQLLISGDRNKISYKRRICKHFATKCSYFRSNKGHQFKIKNESNHFSIESHKTQYKRENLMQIYRLISSGANRNIKFILTIRRNLLMVKNVLIRALL